MIELKTATETVESKLYEFHRKMLEQVRSVYVEKQRKLKANYQEHQRQEALFSWHEDFIRQSKSDAQPIDFLSQFEIYQNLYKQVRTQRLNVEPVETSDILESLDFRATDSQGKGMQRIATQVFGDEKIGRDIMSGFRSAGADGIKDKIFERGA